jgi:RNA polymerase sigma factor FliA
MKCTKAANDLLWSELAAAKATRETNQPRYEAARNALLEANYALVRVLAGRKKRNVPDKVTVEELESAAVEGLWHAVERYDPSRGWQFNTFATRRINGAMQDWLRSHDVFSRLGRNQRQAADQLEQTLGRTLTTEERSQVQTSRRRKPTRGLMADDADRYVTLPAERAALHNLSPLLQGLKTRQRLLVLLYYVDGMPMKKIAEELAVSESRISQMHAEILERMAGTLQRAG